MAVCVFVLLSCEIFFYFLNVACSFLYNFGFVFVGSSLGFFTF